MQVVRVTAVGGPEALVFVDDAPIPTPAAGQIVVDNHCIGVNFIDTYHRTGLYPIQLPATLGVEGCGLISAVGEGVTQFALGDHVAHCLALGAYAQFTAVPANRAVRVPESVHCDAAGGSLINGCTAHALVTSVHAVARGDTVLVHAAAGGMGQWLVQLCRLKNARVIGTAGGPEKCAAAVALGCDVCVDYSAADVDWPAAVRATAPDGVTVVYDGVGAATFEGSLDCLAPRGLMCSFGNASGPPPAIAPLDLARRGSLSLCRPRLADYFLTDEEAAQRMREVIEWVASGAVRVSIGLRLPLERAAEAHRALEGRQTMGKIILTTVDAHE